jgi:hypothetical protein
LPSRPTTAHHVGRGDHPAVVEITVLHRLHQVFGADPVGPGLERFLGLVAAGEDCDLDVLAGARGKRDHAADHLVGVAGVDAEVECNLDGLVELGALEVAQRLQRLVDGVQLLVVAQLGGERLPLLGQLGHELIPPPLRGPSRSRSLR